MKKDYFTLDDYFSLNKELDDLNQKEREDPKIQLQVKEIKNNIKKRKQNGKTYEDLTRQYNEVIGAKKKNEIREKLNKMLKFNQNNLEYTEYTLLQPLWYQNKFIPKNTLVAVSNKTHQLLPYLYFDKNDNYKQLKLYKDKKYNSEIYVYNEELEDVINQNKQDDENLKLDLQQYKANIEEDNNKNAIRAVPHNVLSYKNVLNEFKSL